MLVDGDESLGHLIEEFQLVFVLVYLRVEALVEVRRKAVVSGGEGGVMLRVGDEEMMLGTGDDEMEYKKRWRNDAAGGR